MEQPKAYQFLTKHFDQEDLDPATRLLDIADSLEIVGLAVEAEEEFGIEISDDDMENINTVEELAALINRKLKPAQN